MSHHIEHQARSYQTPQSFEKQQRNRLWLNCLLIRLVIHHPLSLHGRRTWKNTDQKRVFQKAIKWILVIILHFNSIPILSSSKPCYPTTLRGFISKLILFFIKHLQIYEHIIIIIITLYLKQTKISYWSEARTSLNRSLLNTLTSKRRWIPEHLLGTHPEETMSLTWQENWPNKSAVSNTLSWPAMLLESCWEFSLFSSASRIQKKTSREDTKERRLRASVASLLSSPWSDITGRIDKRSTSWFPTQSSSFSSSEETCLCGASARKTLSLTLTPMQSSSWRESLSSSWSLPYG